MNIQTTAWSFAESLSVSRQPLLHLHDVSSKHTETCCEDLLFFHTLAERVPQTELSIAIIARLPARALPQIRPRLLHRGIERKDCAIPSTCALAKGRWRCGRQLLTPSLTCQWADLLFARAREKRERKAKSQNHDAPFRMVRNLLRSHGSREDVGVGVGADE